MDILTNLIQQINDLMKNSNYPEPSFYADLRKLIDEIRKIIKVYFNKDV